ncbi:MAG TPA: hypothetical protein VFC46_14605 [Humisphaera sp.]|nr:hypothetical protein [Humisphaera sp.]
MPATVSGQRFQPVSRRNSQVFQTDGGMKNLELINHAAPNIGAETPGMFSLEKHSRVPIREGYDHNCSVAHYKSLGKDPVRFSVPQGVAAANTEIRIA